MIVYIILIIAAMNFVWKEGVADNVCDIDAPWGQRHTHGCRVLHFFASTTSGACGR